MIKPGLFVVGTDTGVGKTFVASAIARTWRDAGHRVGVLKPVASGADLQGGQLVSEDAMRLIEAIGGGIPRDRVTPLVFKEPLAPPIAARRSGNVLTMAQIVEAVTGCLDWWEERADVMVVEGVGGLLCPLAEGATIADLAILLDYPLLIVAHRGLGTLNHVLLTIEAAKLRALRIAGVVLNGARPGESSVVEATNAEELARRLGDVALLASWEHSVMSDGSPVAPEASGWYDLASLPRFPRPLAGRSPEPRP